LLPKSFILILSKIASSQRLHPNFWAKASAKLIQPDLYTKLSANFFQIFFNTNTSPNNRTPYLYIHARMNHKKGIYFVCME
ncbi:MAG: hypothetical protein IJ553_05705, partial [Alloprevotella sp.]|nr:hypothetical protein [Alloprevotella sp.]